MYIKLGVWCFQEFRLIECGRNIYSTYGSMRVDIVEMNIYQFMKNIMYYVKGFLIYFECYEDSLKEFKQGII